MRSVSAIATGGRGAEQRYAVVWTRGGRGMQGGAVHAFGRSVLCGRGPCLRSNSFRKGDERPAAAAAICAGRVDGVLCRLTGFVDAGVARVVAAALVLGVDLLLQALQPLEQESDSQRTDCKFRC